MSADLAGQDLVDSLGDEGARATEAKIVELAASDLSPAAKQAIREAMGNLSEVLLLSAGAILQAGKGQRHRALVMFYDFLGRTCIELRDAHRRLWGIE